MSSLRFVIICLLLLAAVPTQLLAADRPLRIPHEHVDLKTDPTVTWGRLENGLIYAVMPNNEPKDKVSLRLYVGVGSMYELEHEQGLAHYLEHMGFNGSKHFPKANQVVEELQEIGVAFGRDSNAHTSFDETVYKLDMPDAKPETLALGLKVFSDWAGFLTISDEEVNNERGIILSEMRDREGPQMRIWQGIYPRIFPGLQIGNRFPIGTKDSITNMKPEDIRTFYKKWYRSDRMVLTVVGAIEPEATVAAIRKAFNELPAPTTPLDMPDIGTFSPNQQLEFYAQHEPEADSSFLYYSVTKPHSFKEDGINRRRLALHKRLVNSIMNRRLQDYVEDNSEGPVLSGGLSIYDRYGVDIAAISVQPKPDRVLEAVSVLEQELRRFRKFGPTEQELEIAKANIKAGLEQAVARKETRSNRRLSAALYTAVKYDSVFQTPEQNQELTLALLNEVTLTDVQAAVDIAFNGGNQFVGLFGRENLGENATEALRKAWEQSASHEVKAPGAGSASTWAYATAPDAVKPSSDNKVAHNIRQLVYPNNVRANVLARDEKKNEIVMRIRIGVDEAPGKAGIREAFAAFMTGGLEKHTAKDLRQVLAGRRANVQVRASTDAIVLSGSCPPEELELMLQIARAWITDAAWRPDGFTRLRAQWLQSLKAAETDLDAVANNRMQLFTTGGLTHARSASYAEAERITWDDVRAWAEPVFASGSIECSIVGDINEETCVDLLHQYFGSLDKRDALRVQEDLSAADAFMPIAPIPNGHYQTEVKASVERALIRLVWPTDDAGDVRQVRRLSQLGRIVSELLRKHVRERLADAYSPYATNISSMEFEGHGFFLINVGIAPERVAEVEALLQEIINDLLKTGISDDVFNRVMTPTISSLPAYRLGNGYWLGSVVARSQSQPQRLDWAAGMEEDFKSITKDELMELAKKYLSDQPLIVTVVSYGLNGKPESDEPVQVKPEAEAEAADPEVETEE